MKYIKFIMVTLFFIPTLLIAQDAKSIATKANNLLRGESSFARVTMQIIKPDWSREFEMKTWSLEPDYALILITAPARDKGTVTLKRETEVWNWIPKVQRTIKIPPSMMMQPWMGSNFTNDDLVRESSIVEDYTHHLMASDTLDGRPCYQIKLLPKPDVGVVWGKIIMWITQNGYQELKADYYDEDNNRIKSMIGQNIQSMDGRKIPTHWEMIPHNKPGEKTVLIYRELDFNIDVEPSFFSIRNMKRIR
ncbi:MAG: outer membrane lipoprotein-sorting protein [Caldithrix sp.]|nr:outer membrane lipoprotein-sorting protein [Caldithrix sp.]